MEGNVKGEEQRMAYKSGEEPINAGAGKRKIGTSGWGQRVPELILPDCRYINEETREQKLF